MTRQTRRRLGVAVTGALLGATSPLWGPPILRGVPAFEVREVEIAGTRFASEADLHALAGIDSASSIWDDPGPWEASVEGHPLVEEVRIRRAGTDRMRIEVTEVRPVALVPTPVLVAVDATGRRIEVDPAVHRLDLPILVGATLDPETDRVQEEEARLALAVLEEISLLSNDFVDRVSEVRPLDSEAFEVRLMSGSLVETLTLPYRDATRAFLRAAAAIQAAGERGRVVSADARYREKVFVRTGGSR